MWVVNWITCIGFVNTVSHLDYFSNNERKQLPSVIFNFLVRLSKKWMDNICGDLVEKEITVNLALIRPAWRRLTRNADPTGLGKDKAKEEEVGCKVGLKSTLGNYI